MRWVGFYTRRSASSAAEQKHRRLEQRRALLSNRERAPELLDELNQSADRLAHLAVSRSVCIGHQALHGRRPARETARLDGERGEPDEQRGRWRRRRRDDRSMAIERGQVQITGSQPREPQAHCRRADARILRHLLDRSATRNGRRRHQDELDSVDLAWQRFDRKHALQLPALPASRQHDGKPDVLPGPKRKPALPPLLRQLEIAASTARAGAPGEERVSALAHLLLIRAKMHLGYVDYRALRRSWDAVEKLQGRHLSTRSMQTAAKSLKPWTTSCPSSARSRSTG